MQADSLERLKIESLDALELRRLHSDLVLTYKILFELTSIIWFFSFPNPIHNTRGHTYKLFENHCRTNVRQHLFVKRVIKPWNSLRVAPHDLNSSTLLEHVCSLMILVNFLFLFDYVYWLTLSNIVLVCMFLTLFNVNACILMSIGAL